MDNTMEYNVSTVNRYEPLSPGNVFHTPTDIRPPSYEHGQCAADQGLHSLQNFASMSSDDKLCHILNKLINIENNQSGMCHNIQCLEASIKSFHGRLDTVVSCVDTHSKMLKLIAYKSIDGEARGRRNNLLFRGIGERDNEECIDVMKEFFQRKLSLNPREISIARVHRLGRPRFNYIRPIIVAFTDYTDTEYIMSKAYRLKGSGYGIDRDYPREITDARKKLYPAFKLARETGKKPSIKYPARLVVDGKTQQDEIPDWYDTMQGNRLGMLNDLPRGTYSTSTIADTGTNAQRQSAPVAHLAQSPSMSSSSRPSRQNGPTYSQPQHQTMIGQHFNSRPPPHQTPDQPRQPPPSTSQYRSPPPYPCFPPPPPPQMNSYSDIARQTRGPSPNVNSVPHSLSNSVRGPDAGVPSMSNQHARVACNNKPPSSVASDITTPTSVNTSVNTTHTCVPSANVSHPGIASTNNTYNVLPTQTTNAPVIPVVSGPSYATSTPINNNTNKRKPSQSPIVDESASTLSPESDHSQSLLPRTDLRHVNNNITTSSGNVNNSEKSVTHGHRSSKRHQSRARKSPSDNDGAKASRDQSTNDTASSDGANRQRDSSSQSQSRSVSRPRNTNNGHTQ